jgi:hypothetical protein
MERIDLTGKRFGKLAVTGFSHISKDGQACWECECDCGKVTIVRGGSLRRGDSKTCGCSWQYSKRRIDLAGKRFGRLVAVEHRRHDKYTSAYWLCRCDCGEEVVVAGGSLKRGLSKSCGCLREILGGVLSVTHGDTKEGKFPKEYQAWNGMKMRCYNAKTKRFKDYGGRGIRVCGRWKDSYQNFLADVGRAPSPEYSIDRIDNNGNYEPGNVRWATRSQQMKNRRPMPCRYHDGLTGQQRYVLRNRRKRCNRSIKQSNIMSRR